MRTSATFARVSTNIHVTGVPKAIRAKVRRRAAARGQSMSEYVRALIRKDLALPTQEEFAKRIAKVEPVILDRPIARDIEELRALQDGRVPPHKP